MPTQAFPRLNQNIVFVDSKVPDWQMLVRGMVCNIPVVLLDATRDGVEQMTQILARGYFQAVHILSHGSPGSLSLGNTTLNLDSLKSRYASLVKGWRDRLTPDADILLYGCSVATEAKFIDRLATLTQANIAASLHKTGSSALGGNWELETRIGKVRTPLAIATATQIAYTGVLAEGDLDPSFGGGGIIIADFGVPSVAEAAIVQPNTQIILAGTAGQDFAIARFNSNGSLDTSFGNTGKVRIDFGGNDLGNAAVLQPDGKIIVAGTVLSSTSNGTPTGGDVGLARFNSDGTLDTAFGTGGKVITDFGSSDSGNGVALQPDGKIVAVGSTSGGLVLARYNPDGTLDPTFGNGGKTTLTATNSPNGNAVAIQPDGKIVVAGSQLTSGGLGPSQFALAAVRFNSDGTLDTSFGNAGIATGRGGSFSSANAIAVQPDGKLVEAAVYAGFSPILFRYNSNGTTDTAFGFNGSATPTVSNGGGSTVLIEPNGKLLLGGTSGNNIFVSRFLSDGSPDVSFGNNGTTLTNLGGRAAGNSLAIQPDGNLLLAGGVNVNYDFQTGQYASGNFVAARYLGTPTPTPTPTPESTDICLCNTIKVNLVNPGGSLIEGTDNNDSLFGGFNNDAILAGNGDDLLAGYDGNDILFGGADNDTAFGNQGVDLLEGNEGADRLYGGKGNDLLCGDEGNDLLAGDREDDQVYGCDGDDSLFGGRGNDTLYGSVGNDTLSGDLDDDLLFGGSGSDLFLLRPNGGFEIVGDFQNTQDFIGLSGGLRFEDLELVQNGNNTAIRLKGLGTILASLTGVSANSITPDRFTTLG